MVKYRNPVLVIVFSIITLGIYGIYWLVSTTNELRRITSSAPNPMAPATALGASSRHLCCFLVLLEAQ